MTTWLFGGSDDVEAERDVKLERETIVRNHAARVDGIERELAGITARLQRAEASEADLADAVRHARDDREQIELARKLADVQTESLTLRLRVQHITTELDRVRREKP